MTFIGFKKILLTGLALAFCVFATARQPIFIDTLAASPFPLTWNIVGNYNPNGKPYYVVSLHNKAYAYADKNKFLKQLPFELPKPRSFFCHANLAKGEKWLSGGI